MAALEEQKMTMKQTLFPALAMGALTLSTISAYAKGPAPVTVSLKTAQGADAGTVVLRQEKGFVTVKVDVKGLPPGEHAIHVHSAAKCDPPDFKTAGPHFNPDQKEHGFLNPKGHHNGDMANFTVKPNGTAKATIKDADVVLGTGSEPNSLFANGGTALMIHAKADDMKTDPAGNAGDRIACGVITK